MGNKQTKSETDIKNLYIYTISSLGKVVSQYLKSFLVITPQGEGGWAEMLRYWGWGCQDQY